jgi:hypothetical protein
MDKNQNYEAVSIVPAKRTQLFGKILESVDWVREHETYTSVKPGLGRIPLSKFMHFFRQ